MLVHVHKAHDKYTDTEKQKRRDQLMSGLIHDKYRHTEKKERFQLSGYVHKELHRYSYTEKNDSFDHVHKEHSVA